MIDNQKTFQKLDGDESLGKIQRLLLFSDGSMTNNLELLTNSAVEIEVNTLNYFSNLAK